MIYIREVGLEDAEVFWALRLEALRNNPEAFGVTYEDSVQLSLSENRERVAGNLILGAFTEEGRLAGTVAFKREQGVKVRHKGTIWGVYVSPDYRGQGLAERLFTELVNQVSTLEGLQQINLVVVTTNSAAIKLYKKLGFRTFGTEKNAFLFEGQGYDKDYMVYYIPQHMNESH